MTHITPPPQRTSFLAGPAPGSLSSPLLNSPLCSRVRGGSRAGEAGPVEGGGEGDRRCLLSGLQLVAGGTPTQPVPQRITLGEHKHINHASARSIMRLPVALIRIYVLLLLIPEIEMVAVRVVLLVVLVSMSWFSADYGMLLQRLLLRYKAEKQVLAWLFNVSSCINSPGNWDITLQHICVMEGLLPSGEGWLQLYLHLHNRWLL